MAPASLGRWAPLTQLHPLLQPYCVLSSLLCPVGSLTPATFLRLGMQDTKDIRIRQLNLQAPWPGALLGPAGPKDAFP